MPTGVACLTLPSRIRVVPRKIYLSSLVIEGWKYFFGFKKIGKTGKNRQENRFFYDCTVLGACVKSPAII